MRRRRPRYLYQGRYNDKVFPAIFHRPTAKHFRIPVVGQIRLDEIALQPYGGDLRWKSRDQEPLVAVVHWFLDHQAARTDSGRPRSSMRLRMLTAMRVSVSCAGRVWERKVSPMMRLYRLIVPSTPALAL